MKVPIKSFLIIYLGGLLLLASFVVRQPERILWGVVLIVICGGLDVLWTYLKKKVWYVPISSIITALILALVFDTATRPEWAIAAGILAIAGKQLLHFGRMRHLMNPSAFSMVIISLLVPVVSWWGLAWGNFSLLLILPCGVYILYRTARIPMALAFLGAYLIGLIALMLGRGLDAALVPQLLVASLLDGTLLFFATVMLIEPITTSYPKKQQIFFGLSVGILVSVLSLTRLPLLANMDPLLLALVIGNLFFGLRIIPKKQVSLKKENMVK